MTVTSKPPPEIQSLIDTHIDGFNSQASDSFLSVFADSAIIIDDIAPYRWLTPNAPATSLLFSLAPVINILRSSKPYSRFRHSRIWSVIEEVGCHSSRRH